MNLATAKTIIANWDKPLIRQIFWYLVIPAHVAVQQAEPLTYAYCNAQRISYRLIYLIKFLLALGAFALTTLIDGAPTLALLLQLASGYLIAMYGVWALAYWSMKQPASSLE
jgi:hypothetical protein